MFPVRAPCLKRNSSSRFPLDWKLLPEALTGSLNKTLLREALTASATNKPLQQAILMRKALPQMLEIAALLIAHEAGVENGAAIDPGAAAGICEKLRPALSILMGATGFRILLARALKLASTEAPALRALSVNSGGSLVNADDAVDTAVLYDTEAGVALVAQLLSLLVAFIGDTLTLQLLADIWPRQLAHVSKSRTGDRK